MTTMFQAPSEATGNRLLQSLPPASLARLQSELSIENIPAKKLLYAPGQQIHDIYFPMSGVISIVVVGEVGGGVEAATVGREGFVGLPVVLGADSSAARVIGQVSGTSARMPAKALREIMATDAPVRHLVLLYAQALIEQTSQAVLCNRLHSLEERCARWLLMTHDRVGENTFDLTQEFLSQMLGVRRASVTVAAGMLQKAGFIRYVRGKITVLDRKGLEEASCECFRIVSDRFMHLLGQTPAKRPVT